MCICFVDRCLSFWTFPFASVLSVLLRYTDSDYLPLVSYSFYSHVESTYILLLYVIQLSDRVYNVTFPGI